MVLWMNASPGPPYRFMVLWMIFSKRERESLWGRAPYLLFEHNNHNTTTGSVSGPYPSV